MPAEVRWIWTILLVVVVAGLPVVVYVLHRLWRTSRNIERYLAEMKAAGTGIAGHTALLSSLDTTIETAGTILTEAGHINEHTETIGRTLADRAAADPGGGSRP